VPPVPDTNLDDYFALCQRRFANPKIGDTVSRLALDGSNRQPKFIIPSALDRLQGPGQSVGPRAGLGALVPLLLRHRRIPVPRSSPTIQAWDRLTAQSKLAKDEPKAWLAMVDIYGDLARNQTFIIAFTHALTTLWSIGTKATLERYLADSL
jgi:mannitol 2-dehydrogenase